MITSKDIRNKRFEKAAFGYKQEEIDEFLSQLEAELDEMERERAEANNKIQILADKVREYMKDEDALKDALLGAQRQGHQVIEEAKEKAEKILAEANAKSDEILSDTRVQLEREKKILANTQKASGEFKRDLLELYKEHIGLINSIPGMVDEEAEEVEEEVEEVETEEAEEETV